MRASRMVLPRLLGALVALTLLATACSGDDDPPDDGSSATDGTAGAGTDDGADEDGLRDVPDPCTLVTVDDLQGFFASPFDPGVVTDSPQAGLRQCTWSNTDAPPVKVISIAVGTDASLSAAFDRDAKELFGLSRAAVEASDSVTEADLGLGDESYRAASGIYVLDGGTSYTFSSTGQTDDAVAGVKALATQVLGG